MFGAPGLVVGFLGATGRVQLTTGLKLTAAGLLIGIVSLIVVNIVGWRP
jgi:hypothetical protein